MLRRIPRFLRNAVLVVVVLAVSASVYQSWSAGAPGAGGWTQTEFGPLGPADRDLLVKVRLAGLWEGPTGQQAQQQASSPEVKEVGGNISREHAQLDEEVRKVANQLGVLLPSSPNAQQVAWMNEISAQTGSDYDRAFVQITRQAHGTVLPVISEVRSSTRNDLVRQFAGVADEFVTRHHEYLESTGLVDYAALPQPKSPGLLSGATSPQDLIVPVLVFVAAVLAAIGLVAGLRNRGSARPGRVTVPPRTAAASMVAPMAALNAVAAIPGPRTYTESPDSRWSVTDSGPHRTAMGPGPYGPGPATGIFGSPADSGPYRTVSGSGYYPTVNDSGPHRGVYDSGPHRSVHDSGPYPGVYDSGPHRPVTDSGSYRNPTDSGSYRNPTDSGSYRNPTDSGSHRASARSNPRHSVRR